MTAIPPRQQGDFNTPWRRQVALIGPATGMRQAIAKRSNGFFGESLCLSSKVDYVG